MQSRGALLTLRLKLSFSSRYALVLAFMAMHHAQ
jgi:hypothetical protein